MLIKNIIRALQVWAPPAFQESYDNATLLTGQHSWACTGILCTLDATEQVIEEAASRGCNLVVAHHPILFKGLKSFSGETYVERALVKAIKLDIAIFAIHTNLDNVLHGVNRQIADRLGLQQLRILQPKDGLLSKLYTYVPVADADAVREALFAAGAGKIGLYEECSFQAIGTGTFKPLAGANPVLGQTGRRETVPETRMEVIFPAYQQAAVLAALLAAHPYETVAYEIIRLENRHQEVGSGVIGLLPEAVPETLFLEQLKTTFGIPVIRHTPLLGKQIRKVALCGGAGSFLTRNAIAAGADIYLTADVKYHEFFDADGRLVLADIGHWESEQYTIDLIRQFLQENFPTFAVLKTDLNTNPVHYY